MNKIFTLLLVAGFLSSCLPAIITPSTLQPINTPQIAVTEIPNSPNVGYLKTNLEVQRNGKSYQVVVGYDAGDGWRNDAPKLEYPDWFEEAPQVQSSIIHWAGDIDGDGEMEFIVEIFNCGASCSNIIQVYDYDPIGDEYRLFDQIDGVLGEEYKDVDQDNYPEIISKNAEVFSVISTGSALGPILIYKYQDDKLTVVTKQYPELVEEDAAHWLEATKSDAWGQGAGYITLASYLYDMYLLGEEGEGNTTFQEICSTYVDLQIQNPDWNCDEYFLEIQKRILSFQNSESQ